MAEPGSPTPTVTEPVQAPAGPARSKDEVALELMKFIAVATGLGRSTQSSAGFSGKPVTRSSEEHAEALLDLFERCRRVVSRE
jgi:hypothetical protein